MPAKILLIRHGETDYNAVPRMQGWLDIPLNANGHSQAKLTAQTLSTHHIDAIYSSDLIRARETAKPLAHYHNLEITLTQHLRERDMGIFTGWAWEHERDQMKDSLWPEFEKARNEGNLDWDKHQGETLRQMTNRISLFMEQLHRDHKHQTVAVITHGGTINIFFEHLKIKESIEGFRAIGNGAVHTLIKHHDSYKLEESS